MRAGLEAQNCSQSLSEVSLLSVLTVPMVILTAPGGSVAVQHPTPFEASRCQAAYTNTHAFQTLLSLMQHVTTESQKRSLLMTGPVIYKMNDSQHQRLWDITADAGAGGEFKEVRLTAAESIMHTRAFCRLYPATVTVAVQGRHPLAKQDLNWLVAEPIWPLNDKLATEARRLLATLRLSCLASAWKHSPSIAAQPFTWKARCK